MENEKKPKKLTLNKERIAHMTNAEMQSVLGGDGSTAHDFTCSWCTSGYNQNPDIYATKTTIYGQYSGDTWGVGGYVNTTGGGGIKVYINF